MGLETKCQARIGGEDWVAGKLHVDSVAISFAARGVKWSANLDGKLKAKTNEGQLVVGSGKSSATFALGDAAEKWLDKVLHPPSRLDKLAIKPDQTCFLSAGLDKDFLDELANSGTETTKSIAKATIAIVLIESAADLTKASRTVSSAQPKTQFWFLWPKGVSEVTQADVMAMAAEAGMGPSKACSFSDRLSAMRFLKKA